MPKRRIAADTGLPVFSVREQTIIDGTAVGLTQAAIGDIAGYSSRSGYSTISEALKKPEIQKAVERSRQQLLQTPRATFKEAVGRLAIAARGDVADLFPDDPLMQAAKANGQSKLIKKFKRTPGKHGDVIEIELYPATEAIQTLAKLYGWEKMPDANPAQLERAAAAKLAEQLVAIPGLSEEERGKLWADSPAAEDYGDWRQLLAQEGIKESEVVN